MGASPSHRFGQIIGEVLEAAVTPLLADFAEKNHLFLDKHGARPCRNGTKCTWVDLNGNSHDLDFVLERGGTPQAKGIPAAFVETAWRRYTKHSRNKAQEIQGALIPLVETYKNAGPFVGAILAGVYTEGALNQLKSLGFTVLFFPYETVVKVFGQFGIDAAYDEDTPDRLFAAKVRIFKKMPSKDRSRLAAALLAANKSGTDHFMEALAAAVSRQVTRIIVLSLHGTHRELKTIDDALEYITSFDETLASEHFERYEIEVAYNNGNVTRGRFNDKPSAIEFLKSYQPIAPTSG
jgi:hypothetical protein